LNPDRTTNLILTPGELSGAVEALHDAVLRRIGWSISHDITWRTLDLVIAQEVINLLISAYTKAMMLYREEDFAKAEDFEKEFGFSDEIWDLLATFTKAKEWSEVPYHTFHGQGCHLCEKIPMMP
jgi:hypothetical protein